MVGNCIGFAIEAELRRDAGLGNIPIVVADITSAACALLCSSSSDWMVYTSAGDAAWRALIGAGYGGDHTRDRAGGGERDRDREENRPGISLYGNVGVLLRDMVIKRRAEGWKWVLLLAVREEKPFLLRLPPAP